MEHPNAPPDLLDWLIENFKGTRAPNYERAAKALEKRTGFHVEPDTLRHVACGYKPPSGPLAAAIQTWTKDEVEAIKLLTWEHYSRERAA